MAQKTVALTYRADQRTLRRLALHAAATGLSTNALLTAIVTEEPISAFKADPSKTMSTVLRIDRTTRDQLIDDADERDASANKHLHKLVSTWLSNRPQQEQDAVATLMRSKGPRAPRK